KKKKLKSRSFIFLKSKSRSFIFLKSKSLHLPRSRILNQHNFMINKLLASSLNQWRLAHLLDMDLKEK
ncbi:hypothetical protein MTR67_048967, partial [Solanum verrucosum]